VRERKKQTTTTTKEEKKTRKVQIHAKEILSLSLSFSHLTENQIRQRDRRDRVQQNRRHVPGSKVPKPNQKLIQLLRVRAGGEGVLGEERRGNERRRG